MLAFLLACSGSPETPDPDTGADTGDTAVDTDTAGDTADTAPFDPPEWCPEEGGGLLDVTTTDASPYFLHHPATDDLTVPTVIFLAGGPGNQGSAVGAFGGWLEGGEGLDEVRVVMPYADDGDLTDEFSRTVDILDEVLACFGGDPDQVHIAGTSNGGRGSFGLMLESPERFATLLGAPGIFTTSDTSAIQAALAGKRVYNGVGELDTSWQPYVEQTHATLLDLGIDSVYVEFAGEGHLLSDAFDTTVFFDFWLDR